MDRRTFLRMAGVAVAGSALVHELWTDVARGATVAGPGPYGALGSADARGVRLPAGFSSRIAAVTGQPVAGSAALWHSAPDGGACFARPGGGWVYVSNAEVAAGGGGAGVIVFDADGAIVGSYRVLTGTTSNCAGGPTPWGTWLSCEETAGGRVWECDPQSAGQGVARPGLGAFQHEAAAVDPATSVVYLTEDQPTGRLYRFVPTVAGDLSAGQLQAASVSGTSVVWRATSATAPDRSSNTTAFNGGEGAWVSGGSLFFTTKGDQRVWELVLATQTLTVLYDANALVGAALRGVDNVTGHERSGDLFVAEDGGDLEVCVLARQGAQRVVAAFARLEGHAGSEITGPAFSPDGTRLYFSSQRGVSGLGTGVTYEITGPFRDAAPVSPVDIGFVGAATENANVRVPGVRVPASVQPGDLALLVVTANRDTTAATPAGWTLLGTVADAGPDTRSWLYSTVASATLAGSRVTVRLAATAKVCSIVAAYRGAASAVVVAGIEDSAASTVHRSPSLPALPAGSWVISCWADESAANSGWTPPVDHRVRTSSVGSGAARITAIMTDIGPSPAGPWPGAAATSTASSRKAVAWSVGLARA